MDRHWQDRKQYYTYYNTCSHIFIFIHTQMPYMVKCDQSPQFLLLLELSLHTAIYKYTDKVCGFNLGKAGQSTFLFV